MSDFPDRARRAFSGHDAFAAADEQDRYVATATPFEGVVAAEAGEGGHIRFDVTVRVPMLDATTDDDVAPVVEEGWYETLERRLDTVGGGVLAGDHDPEPTVTQTTHEGSRVAEVTTSFEDIDPKRGVDDAAAFVDFVEGTYVQGVIPGYDYVDPVAGIIAEARRAAGSDGVEQ